MEQEKIDTASTYINNLLLARGLLRSGKPIEFAKLSRAASTRADGSNEGKKQAHAPTIAAAEIINLVHDLILRRDRDQEQHESLGMTLRALRAEKSRESSELEKLKEQNRDLRRQVALHQFSTRAAETTASSAESSARALREEGLRLKTTLSQVRTQCANDVRKRDVELSKLKTHLAARQRGNKASLIGASITINPGSTGRGSAPQSHAGGSLNEDPLCVEDASYSLKQETTDFLTQLSQGLSEENDSLIALFRNTLSTLKELLGLPHNQPHAPQVSQSASLQSHVAGQGEELVRCPPTSYQALSVDLDGVLGSLTSLLTNPSFAPIEEVHAREEEIQRLREGWEKMEIRWREAISLMQGWKRRMLTGGGHVNVEELKSGLRLGEGLDSPSRRFPQILADEEGIGESEESNSEGQSGDEPDVDDLDDVDDSLPHADRPIFEDDPLDAEPVQEDLVIVAAADHPLKETSTNANPRKPGHVKEGKAEEGRNRHQADFSSPLPPKPTLRSTVTVRPAAHKAPSRKVSLPQAVTAQASRANSQKPSSAMSQLPKKTKAKAAPGPRLSVDEKLRMAETEARRVSSSPLNLRSEEGEPAAEKQPVKRSRISGRPRRRKSTLSPEELEDLMGS